MKIEKGYENMQLYNEKRIDYFSSARSEILEMIPKFSDRVLEIGCGSGQTLEMLKELQVCNETIGVELFEDAANAAKNRVDKIYCMNIESQALPENIGKFDLILLLDVLEHLVDPWVILSDLRENFLAVGGRIIISLPNARHYSLVLPLLAGKFDYMERGILDKTHLRFFTKDSAINFVKNAGLKINKVKGTSLSIQLNSGKFNALTLGILSGFIASQYIISASSDAEN